MKGGAGCGVGEAEEVGTEKGEENEEGRLKKKQKK